MKTTVSILFAALLLVAPVLTSCRDGEEHAPERTLPRPGGGGSAAEGEGKEEPGEVEPAETTAANLADGRMRIVGAGVNLVYGEPGVMFLRSDGGRHLHAASLENGSEAGVTAPGPLLSYGVSAPDPVADGIVLEINGRKVALERVELMRADATRVWFRFVAVGGAVVWLVADGDFSANL